MGTRIPQGKGQFFLGGGCDAPFVKIFWPLVNTRSRHKKTKLNWSSEHVQINGDVHVARTGVRELCDLVRCACSQSVRSRSTRRDAALCDWPITLCVTGSTSSGPAGTSDPRGSGQEVRLLQRHNIAFRQVKVSGEKQCCGVAKVGLLNSCHDGRLSRPDLN